MFVATQLCIRYPPLCHIHPSCNAFGFLVSELTQGRKTGLPTYQPADLPQLGASLAVPEQDLVKVSAAQWDCLVH